MLTRGKWTKGPGTHPVCKGLIWFTYGYKLKGGNGAGVYGQSLARRLSISPGKYDTVFQAGIYAILACAYEIQMNVRLENMRVFALTALHVAKTSPLV
jgi:hypothetical protein